MANLRFKGLRIWKLSVDLAKEIYKLTNEFPENEKYGLISQMQRASISIPSNIAEGSGRGTRKDFIHFLIQARGSLFEILTQLELSGELGFGKIEIINELEKNYEELAKQINAFISSLRSVDKAIE